MNKDCHLIFEQYRLAKTNLIIESVQKAIEIKNKYFPNLTYSDYLTVVKVRVKDETVEKIYGALAEQQVAKTAYLNWIFLLMQNGVPRILEDLETIAKHLKVFNAKSSKIAADGYPVQLFDQRTKELIYKKPEDLYDVVDNYIEADEKGEKLLLKKGRYFASKGEADKVYENDDYVVYSPKTYNASKELGCFSTWCTRFPDMYQRYSEDGPLYIVFDKFKLGENLFGKSLEGDESDDMRMIQIHIPSRQFKDIKNRSIQNKKEFMNRLKGFFNVLYPTALKEYTAFVNGQIKREDLSKEAKESMFIMPKDYRDGLNMPCDEIQEKIAAELRAAGLSVDCQDVEEADYGYEVDGKVYVVSTVEDATDQAVDSFKDSGLDDEWFVENILDGEYSWEDVYSENDYNAYPISTAKEAFYIDEPEDYKRFYEDAILPRNFDELGGKEYTEEDIMSGKYLNDLPYEKFISILIDQRSSDPVRYYVEELGNRVEDLGFIDLDKKIREWIENSHYEDRLGSAVSSYDGMAYYFDIDGKEMIMYRVE